jgi:hypothetical protein
MKYYEEKLPFRGRYNVFPKIYRRERHVLVSGFVETFTRPQGVPTSWTSLRLRLESLTLFLLGPLDNSFFFWTTFHFPCKVPIHGLEGHMKIFREIFEKIKSPLWGY